MIILRMKRIIEPCSFCDIADKKEEIISRSRFLN